MGKILAEIIIGSLLFSNLLNPRPYDWKQAFGLYTSAWYLWHKLINRLQEKSVQLSKVEHYYPRNLNNTRLMKVCSSFKYKQAFLHTFLAFIRITFSGCYKQYNNTSANHKSRNNRVTKRGRIQKCFISRNTSSNSGWNDKIFQYVYWRKVCFYLLVLWLLDDSCLSNS